MQKIIEWILPIKTVSEANCCEHWTKKHKRHKVQQQIIWYQFAKNEKKIHLPCRVKLTRISSRKLDEGDNLPCAFKWIRDQIASHLTGISSGGRADDTDMIKWEYSQEKGRPQSIKVEIYVPVY